MGRPERNDDIRELRRAAGEGLAVGRTAPWRTPRVSGGGATPAGPDHPLIYLRNITTQDWPAGSIIRPSAPFAASFTTRVLTYDGLPLSSSAAKWAVTLQPIAAQPPGEDPFTGLAATTGLRWVRVQISDAQHQWARAAPGFFDRLQSTASPSGEGVARIEFKSGASTGLVDCIVDLDQRGEGEGDTHFVCLVLDANEPMWEPENNRGSHGVASVVPLTYDTQTGLYVAGESPTVVNAQWFGKQIQIDSTAALWGIGHIDEHGNRVLDEAGCGGDEFTHGLSV